MELTETIPKGLCHVAVNRTDIAMAVHDRPVFSAIQKAHVG
jgi:hypothetical protein